MARNTSHVVSGHHNGSDWPFIVAEDPGRYGALVDTLLHDPDAEDARTHASTWFYVADAPLWDKGHEEWPKRWLRVGFHNGHGGALFFDQSHGTDRDWAWVALAARPASTAPTVFYDQPGGTTFPPRAVMPLDELRSVVLEWVSSGERPGSVAWLAINALVWHVTEDGEVALPKQRIRQGDPWAAQRRR